MVVKEKRMKNTKTKSQQVDLIVEQKIQIK